MTGRERGTEETEASVPHIGCALMAASFVFMLLFGVMSLGALFPNFVFLALGLSTISLSQRWLFLSGLFSTSLLGLSRIGLRSCRVGHVREGACLVREGACGVGVQKSFLSFILCGPCRTDPYDQPRWQPSRSLFLAQVRDDLRRLCPPGTQVVFPILSYSFNRPAVTKAL